MFNSQTYKVSDITKTWTVLFAVLFATFFWQYSNASAKAEENTVHQTATVAAAQPTEPALTPEQLAERQREQAYERAGFLEVVETGDRIRYSNSDLFCMAKNIYHEAGNEPILGRFAVAQVTINRAKDPAFGGDICDVVFAPYQFSWANNHSRRWTTPSGEAWEKAKEIARQALEGKRIKGMEEVLYYHANYVNPRWRNVDRLTRIGAHIFYERDA